MAARSARSVAGDECGLSGVTIGADVVTQRFHTLCLAKGTGSSPRAATLKPDNPSDWLFHVKWSGFRPQQD